MSITLEILKPEITPAKNIPDAGTINQRFRIRATSDSATNETLKLAASTNGNYGGLESGLSDADFPGALSINSSTEERIRTFDVNISVEPIAENGDKTIYFGNADGLSIGNPFTEYTTKNMRVLIAGDANYTLTYEALLHRVLGNTRLAYFPDWVEIASSAKQVDRINHETLSGVKYLKSADPKFQHLAPGYSTGTVVLPTSPVAGDNFVIKNDNSYSNMFYLSIRIDSETGTEIDRIYPNSVKAFIYTGSDWAGNANGAATDNSRNIIIGRLAKGGNNCVVLGDGAEANTGVAIGQDALGNNGAAIGKDANIGSYHFAYAQGRGSVCKYSGHINHTVDDYSKYNTGQVIFHGTTTANNEHELFVDGISERLSIAGNTAVLIDFNILCFDTGAGNYAGAASLQAAYLSGMAIAHRKTGTVNWQGITDAWRTINMNNFPTGTPEWRIAADTNYNAIRFFVKGIISVNMDWCVVFDLKEIRQ